MTRRTWVGGTRRATGSRSSSFSRKVGSPPRGRRPNRLKGATALRRHRAGRWPLREIRLIKRLQQLGHHPAVTHVDRALMLCRKVIQAPVAHVHVGKQLGAAPRTRLEPSCFLAAHARPPLIRLAHLTLPSRATCSLAQPGHPPPATAPRRTAAQAHDAHRHISRPSPQVARATSQARGHPRPREQRPAGSACQACERTGSRREAGERPARRHGSSQAGREASPRSP